MPANKKYLTSSALQRFLKISAGFVGGYGVMLTFFLMFAHFFEPKYVMGTAMILGYILWAVLLLLAFLAKSGWKIWGVYLLLMLLFSLPYLIKL
ncbi:hypothetical protein [Olivibacter sitiensis]|uniref:hypothetical protein n=1 Tax=Olivibacter sitiensis TaxID=376470 RepID=UPI0003FA9612|nr:hypothetical protein [Olivibacter sitiensis]